MMTLMLPQNAEQERELAEQAERDGQIEFWMRVADKAKMSLPAMARLGTEAMAALALRHLDYTIPHHGVISLIMREPEFET